MRQLFLLLLVITAVAAYNKLDLPYQAHSMNDLNLTLQELIKGVNNFKFDVSLATIESCENQSTWDRDYSQCGYFDYGLNTCCLALRGDCSQEPVFQQHFNTSDDMIAMVSNPKYAFIFSKDTTIPKYQQTKYFAFNFQYGSYDNSMTVDFVYKFLKAIEEKNLNLRMVTGSTGMLNLFDNKCIEQQACNEKELYIDNADIIIQTGSQTQVPRTQQFNEEPTSLDSVCANGFPNYMKGGDVPFQFWEPSYQDAVYDTYDKFWSNKCMKIGINSPVNRFKITSNLNSENYATFLQKANDQTSDSYVPPKYRYKNAQNSLIAQNSQLGLTFVSYFYTYIGIQEIDVYTQSDFKYLNDAVQFQEKLIKITSKGSYLVAETVDKFYILTISISKTLEFKNNVKKPQNYIGFDIVIQNNWPYLAVSTFSDSEIQVSLVDALNGKIQWTVNQPVINVSADGFQDISSIILNGQLVQVYTYEQLNEQSISEVYFLHNTVSLDTFTSSIDQSDSALNYGSKSSLKLEEFNGQLFFIQVSGDGSCWSGVFINNGDWCKCTLHQNDKFINLRNVQYTITYMWGRLSDLVDRIKTSTFINSCDPKIISSKVYNGRNPQIAVRRDEKNRPTAYVAMEYTHYDELPLLTTLFLGSNSYEAEYANTDVKMVEVVSFDLLEFDIFNLPY